MSKSAPTPFSVHVGRRFRAVRDLRPDVDIKTAADAVGVSYKHMYRLESGETKLGAEQLYRLARAYALPVSFFLQGVPEDDEELERQRLVLKSDPRNWKPGAADEEEAALLALWRALESGEQRGHLLGLLESLVFPEQAGRRKGR